MKKIPDTSRIETELIEETSAELAQALNLPHADYGWGELLEYVKNIRETLIDEMARSQIRRINVQIDCPRCGYKRGLP